MLDNDKKYKINLKYLARAIIYIRREKKVSRTELEVLMWCYHHGVFKMKDYTDEFKQLRVYAQPRIKKLIARHLIKKKSIRLRHGAHGYYLTSKGLSVVKDVYRFLQKED